MRKPNLLFIAICFVTSFVFGQNCPDPIKEKYLKVTSLEFAKEFENCPVTIEAEFLSTGYLSGYRKPRKLRKMFYFQCVKVGEEGKKQGFNNVISGQFFVIEKDKADLVFNLKKGDKLELTGTSFTQNYFGTKIAVFFKVSGIKKLN